MKTVGRARRTPANRKSLAMVGRGAVLAVLLVAGCAARGNSGDLVDPLKQRLIAREDIALQNVLLGRMPAYSGGGWDAPYEGPVVEPPLPDLNLLPEDLPPWEELPPIPVAEETASTPGAAPVVSAPSPEPSPVSASAEPSTP